MTEHVHGSEEAEVVVVGYGGAGAVTAIAAADAGAKVLIMEKQPADTPTSTHHTPSTRMSGGAFICPEDPEKAIHYFLGLRRIANEPADSEEESMIKLLAGRMAGNIDWMESIGSVIGGKEGMSPTFAHKERAYGPAAFDPQKFTDPVVLDLIEKITVEPDPNIPESGRQGISEITTRDGRKFEKRIDVPHGFGDDPLTDTELEDKFGKMATKYMRDEHIQKIFDAVWNTEALDNISTLTALMAFPKQ
jgi:hypothetical protein